MNSLMGFYTLKVLFDLIAAVIEVAARLTWLLLTLTFYASRAAVRGLRQARAKRHRRTSPGAAI